MGLNPVTIFEQPFGIEIKLKNFVFLFGNRNSNLAIFEKNYPALTWASIKQVHGDQCVLSSVLANAGEQIEADAQWSPQSNHGLCISTADCVPVLIADLQKGTIAAIHAGWRGVANRIVPKMLAELVSNHSNSQHLHIMIGPHIQFSSFEVEEDTFRALKNSLPSCDFSEFSKTIASSKYLVDLNAVVKYQIQEFKIPADHIQDFHYDTKTNLRFHSYRRDQAQAGRQISFVARLP